MVKSDRDRRVQWGALNAERYQHQNAADCPKCGTVLPTKWWLYGGFDYPTEYARRCEQCQFTVIRPATLEESKRGFGGFDPV
jgi:hypothetical protein